MTGEALACKAADYAMAFVAALVLTMLLTPLVREMNRACGMVDKPDARRINKVPIPRGGGLALIVGFFASWTAFSAFLGVSPIVTTIGCFGDGVYWKFLAISCAIGALGLADDRFGMNPRVKLAGQAVCAFAAWAWMGVGFSHLWPELPAWCDCVLTVLWITGAINAFNLIDGMDGLACGLAFIAALGMAGSLIMSGAARSAPVYFAFAGALAGFLRYNFNPASVFLGDCGSMFLGFTLSVLPLVHQMPDSMLVSVGVPLLAMGVPIFDTFLAIFRRTLRRVLKNSEGVDVGNGKVMTADTDHLHHRILRASGMNQRKAALVLYFMAIAAVSTGLCAMALRSRAGGLWMVGVAFASVIVFRDMSRVELFDAGRLLNGIARDNSTAARRKWSRLSVPIYMMADVAALVAVSFFCNWATSGEIDRAFLRMEAPLRIVATFIALALGGTYATVWARAMISNFVRLFLACAAGTVASAAAIYYVANVPPAAFARSTALFAPMAFFALSAVRVARMVIRDIFYAIDCKRLMSVPSPGVSRMLVYGAGLRYRSFRRELVRSASANNRFIVGLIDDDLLLRGKRIGGVEIMGPLLQAPEIVRRTGANEVVIACDVTEEWLKIVRETLEPLGVKVSQFKFGERILWENTTKKK